MQQFKTQNDTQWIATHPWGIDKQDVTEAAVAKAQWHITAADK